MVQADDSGAFGPAPDFGGKNRYRTTNIHQSNGQAPAIAVCNGTICLQHNDTGTYNIILRPRYQPSIDLPFIKYFIYKGITHEGIMNAFDGILDISSTIPFVKSIKEIWLKDKDTSDTSTAPSASYVADVLGLSYNPSHPAEYDPVISDVNGDPTRIFADDQPLDNLFYFPNSKVQKPEVRSGDIIGNFASGGNVGFEIVFERLGFEPLQSVARAYEGLSLIHI